MAHPTEPVPPSAAPARTRGLRISSAPRPHPDQRERAPHIATRPTPRRDLRSPSKISVRWRLQFAVFVRRLRSIARPLRCSIPGASTIVSDSCSSSGRFSGRFAPASRHPGSAGRTSPMTSPTEKAIAQATQRLVRLVGIAPRLARIVAVAIKGEHEKGEVFGLERDTCIANARKRYRSLVSCARAIASP
jgi:hypothetical protein